MAIAISMQDYPQKRRSENSTVPCLKSLTSSDGCDGGDEDCDGVVDSDPDVLWYQDRDGDMLGDASTWVASCSQPLSHVPNNSDCDDTDPEVGVLLWYADADGDGWGREDRVVAQCSQPIAHVAEPGDCADGDDLVHPGAIEVCDDGVDNDCDGGAGPCRWAKPELATDQLFHGAGYSRQVWVDAPGRPTTLGLVDGGTELFATETWESLGVLSAEGLSSSYIGESGTMQVLGVDTLDIVAYELDGLSAPLGAEPAVRMASGASVLGAVAPTVHDDVHGVAWIARVEGDESLLVVSPLEDGSDPMERASIRLSIGTVLEALAVGDFDGDGAEDWATAAGGAGAFLVDGTRPLFGALEEAASAYEPRDVPGEPAVGLSDWDGDGCVDLLVGWEGAESSFSIWGSGSAGDLRVVPPLVRLSTDEFVGSSLQFGDFDGDGRRDVAVASSDPRPDEGSIVLFNATGSFDDASVEVARILPEYGYSAAGAADMDSDGLTDLLFASPDAPDGGALVVLYGVGL